MITPSKLMCQLAFVTRGLDVENSEFSKKNRKKLAEKLRSIITNVSNLEEQETDQCIRLHMVQDCVISLLEEIGSNCDPEKLKLYANEILQAINED